MQAFDWKTFLFSFEGRIRRYDYWVRFVVAYIVVSIVLGIVASILGSIGNVILGLFYLVALWPSLAVSVKRLHDRDYSGWFLLLPIGAEIVAGILYFVLGQFGGIVGGLLMLVVMIWFLVQVWFLRGTVGPNRFGADPLAGVI